MDDYMLSKTGSRELNEDYGSVCRYGREACYVLADGLGGHDKGEAASKLVCEQVIDLFHETAEESKRCHTECLPRYFEESQRKLLELQELCHCKDDMKTTMTILLRQNGKLQWGHVGDTRLYYFKNGRLISRTLDHSVPQMLVASGEIKEKDIRGHDDRNRLLRVMGTPWNQPQYEISPWIWEEEGQAFLLCTDGFWELLEEKRMIYHLKHAKTPKQWVDAMEQEILINGEGKNMDNYSAIGIFGEGMPSCRRHFW